MQNILKHNSNQNLNLNQDNNLNENGGNGNNGNNNGRIDLFCTKSICKILLDKGLILDSQIKIILDKEEKVKQQLEKNKAAANLAGNLRINNQITGIDIVCAFNFERLDKPLQKLDEDTIMLALAEEWKIDFKKIDPLKLDLNTVTSTLPRSFAMKNLVIPISIDNGVLTLAAANPFNKQILDDISRASSQFRLKVVLSSKTDIIKIINEFFGFKKSIAQAEMQFSGPTIDLGNLEHYVKLKDELPSNDQHIVNAVNHIISYAFDQRASDVHIEPKRDKSVIRMRIDGILQTVYKLPKNVHSAMISRIKALSRLDIAEKRRPQDGRIKTERKNIEVEIRISTIPVAFGEKIVMRIMDPEVLFQDLDKLGFNERDLRKYSKFITMPHGIVLVCGPTGSGKTTTLYSTLKKVSSSSINIVTVEDPIEMISEDFNQIAVQPALDITFATVLRNILRQDPDVIMIGEMRDKETSENAIQAALTGHLVLSTLHTNDAPSSLTRLLDLGIPSFLIQSTLIGIISQRLVRKICPNCREAFNISLSKLKSLNLNINLEDFENLENFNIKNIKKDANLKLFHGAGCQKCRNTGYHGRTGVFEIMDYSQSLKKLTTPDANMEAIRIKATEEGMESIRKNAIKKLLNGETTYQEVLRISWE